MMTEAEARQKKCPGWGPGQRPDCVASDCMAWRKVEQPGLKEEHGYCGLTSHGPSPKHHEH